jgi:hypothetical protein
MDEVQGAVGKSVRDDNPIVHLGGIVTPCAEERRKRFCDPNPVKQNLTLTIR